MNKLKQFPRSASFPQLKVLNLNRNADLKALEFGYCPLLESLSASQCTISDIHSLQSCQSLRELDVSSNQLPTLTSILKAIRWNNPLNLTALSFHENTFNLLKDDDNQPIMSNAQQAQLQDFNQVLLRVFPYLTKINGEYLYDVKRPAIKPVTSLPVVFQDAAF